MLSFRNDYSAGAHPAVLEALCRTNLACTQGYGLDPYCEKAADTLRALCQCPQAAVHFLTGGTQVNKVAIAAFLRPYEAVIAAASAHICVHETGSIEHDGHKVLHLPSPDGKLTPDLVRAAVDSHGGEHMVCPRLVYISNTTELGGVYRLEELRALRRLCDELGLLLYCDGARLGSAIAAGDAGFADYGALCDAFTVGGTKNGLLFGEALVIANPALQPGFRHCMKQQGAILAKGRLLGVQFSAILADGLYLALAGRCNALARRLAEGVEALGVPLLLPCESNQLFPILPGGMAEELAGDVSFELQERLEGDRVCVRFVTGWNTSEEDVDGLLSLLRVLSRRHCSPNVC